MADPQNAMESMQWFGTLGVGGVLAGIMFFFYRKDVRQFTELWKIQSDREASRTEMLVTVIKENTESNTKLVGMIDSLHRRFDAKENATRERQHHA